MSLRVQHLHKNFGGIKAVDGCSFGIQPKKITALIGPNGAGKSTVFNIASGLIKEDSGEIFFLGKKIHSLPDFKRAALGIARTFQSVRIFKNMSVLENLLVVLQKGDENIFASLFSKNSDDQRLKIREVLDSVGCDAHLDTRAADLSYGQKKLLELARAIIFPHSLLMLDEPVAGVSPIIRENLKKILIELKNNGETIFLVEHDMNFVFEISDHVIVMDEGRVIASGTPSQIQDNETVLEAYLGKQL